MSARDLFDLSLVIERELRSHCERLRGSWSGIGPRSSQLSERATVLKAQFDAIDVLHYTPSFEDASVRAKRFLESLPASK